MRLRAIQAIQAARQVAKSASCEAKWSIGTCERTAFSLLVYTGQRRSDVVGMTWPRLYRGRTKGWRAVVDKRANTFVVEVAL